MLQTWPPTGDVCQTPISHIKGRLPLQIDQKDRQTMGQMDGQMVRVRHGIINIKSQIKRQTATPSSALLLYHKQGQQVMYM